jgi:hypothetical protein
MMMETAGALPLGYASTAMIRGLFKNLISKEVISSRDANSILDDAYAELWTIDNKENALGAQRIVDDIRTQLGVR